MSIITKAAVLIMVLLAVFGLYPSKAAAQAAAIKSNVTFDSFTGTYFLSHDANGRSLLTTEEVIKADFPTTGTFSGITRVIPKTYQGHSVEVKILSITDAGGSTIPYKTSTNSDGNLVVTTGDPDITLYGFQTYHINYQTKDVVNLNTASNEFLLDANGRGWDQSFNSVDAVLHIPSSFAASLTKKPSCYTVLNSFSNYNGCQISTQTKRNETVITAKANLLAAHQALVVKVDFKPATFTSPKPKSNLPIVLAIAFIGLAATSAYLLLRKRR